MEEKALIESLKHMKDFFEKNKITYWLDTGSLLGAVREKKFIDWDYDLDFGVWSKDINKILKCLSSKSNKYTASRIHDQFSRIQ